MIESYKIVTKKNPVELEQAVNDLLKLGWIPQGGVFAYNTPGGLWFYQALIKYTLNA